ncbi:sensor histidine kinase KdpD [bacterium]|nr:sensor histidine kinase KdpD [bacterium]
MSSPGNSARNEHRPDPDALLARVKEEEARQTRGKLKVFLGAAAGVGKTYAMLEAAHARRAEGMDVVAGWVDTHGRAETEALLEGIEILARRPLEYRGTILKEFDLDAALARRPALILVDELAHTNAPGSRHTKRWQDVQEIIEAGINVYTTLNVQHLESLNDVVAQITGVRVHETVPDSVLERADEVELVDLPPEELLQRLKEGKVYVPEQAREAIRNFFRKGNLIALRELALRRTADRVDEQMQAYMRDHAIDRTWPAAERLLVCVRAGPLGVKLVRAARRMAARLHAEWMTVYVETPDHVRLSETDREGLARTLRLAEQLGGQTVTLSGQSVTEEILAYAQARNVSKIIVGKPAGPRWREILSGSAVDELIRRSGGIDVYVIRGEEGEPSPRRAGRPTRPTHWRQLGWAAGTVGLCTALAWVMFPYSEISNIIMVYLLGTVLVAPRLSRPFTILTSILSVAAFDLFFVPPRFTFAVSDVRYFVTFAVMLVVAIVVSSLTVRIRRQADAARHRERRTAALYDLSRELAGTRGAETLMRTAARHIHEVFAGQVVILLPRTEGGLVQGAAHPAPFEIDADEGAVGQWVFEHRQIAGLETETLPGAQALYIPLIASQGIVGVLGIKPSNPHAFADPEQLHLLETFANQAALAIERAQLAEAAQQAQVRAEAERLRNALFSSISHDLRTPLTTIMGAAGSLLENGTHFQRGTWQDLLQSIVDEAERLNRLVSNLLDMTRIEAGALPVKKDWHPLEEVVGTALARMGKRFRDHPINIHVPADLPLVRIDGTLIEQVFINLLDNGLKYTPVRSGIDISASLTDAAVLVEVADRGPGFGPGEAQRIFDKFYRGQTSDSRGVGLGLAICRAIVEAHGGKIWAENRPGGGAVFRFTLPAKETPPEMPRLP